MGAAREHMLDPVLGLVCELPDGTELPTSLANNKSGSELHALIQRHSAAGWDYSHYAIPEPDQRVVELLSSAELVGGQTRVKVKDFSEAFMVQSSIGNLNDQEMHAEFEDNLDEKYLWGANLEAVEHRNNARQASGAH